MVSRASISYALAFVFVAAFALLSPALLVAEECNDSCDGDCCWTECCNHQGTFEGLPLSCTIQVFEFDCPNQGLNLDCQNYIYPACIGVTCLECCYDEYSEGYNCASTQLNNDVPHIALSCWKWKSEIQQWVLQHGREFTICDV